MVRAKAAIIFTILLCVFLMITLALSADQAKAEYSEKISAQFLAPEAHLNGQTFKNAFDALLNKPKKFTARNETEKRIAYLLDMIVDEHNRDVSAEDKANRFVKSGFVITEAKDKFIQEGGKLWARIRMTYEDGHTEKFIFKQEYAYAMDEIGYYALKTLGIAASYTKRYGDDLFLIKPIGQFNLGKIQDKQYQDREFMLKLGRLSGRAAARAFVLGLADRKAENMRVILNERGMPEEVINADLASSFAHIKEKSLKSSFAEVLGILSDMLTGAANADVSTRELALIIKAFLEGFEKQILDFQNTFQKINTDFENIDPDEYDKLDRMWGVLDNVKARSKMILERINPDIIEYNYISSMLFSAFLKRMSMSFQSDNVNNFFSQLFEKDGVFFLRVQNLLLILKETDETVLKSNKPVLEEIFDAFNDMAVNLSRKENYQAAIMCDNLCIKTGNILINIDQADQRMWQTRMNKVRARLQESLDKSAAFSIKLNIPDFQHLFQKILSHTAAGQAI